MIKIFLSFVIAFVALNAATSNCQAKEPEFISTIIYSKYIIEAYGEKIPPSQQRDDEMVFEHIDFINVHDKSITPSDIMASIERAQFNNRTQTAIVKKIIIK